MALLVREPPAKAGPKSFRVIIRPSSKAVTASSPSTSRLKSKGSRVTFITEGLRPEMGSGSLGSAGGRSAAENLNVPAGSLRPPLQEEVAGFVRRRCCNQRGNLRWLKSVSPCAGWVSPKPSSALPCSLFGKLLTGFRARRLMSDTSVRLSPAVLSYPL